MRKSPYRVYPDEDGYFFITNSKIKYKVIFYNPNSLWKDYKEVRDLIIDFSFFPYNVKGKSIPPDPLVSVTLSYILKRFFKKNPDRIITFVCDSTDGKESGRFKLFEKWFEMNNSRRLFYKENYYHKGDFNFYAGMIMKSNNPHRESAIKAFKETMGLYLLLGE